MIDHEGPKNLFRFLQCRDVDIPSLNGIIIDHACRVDSYVMNREAALIEYKLLLVDGAHWAGMRQLKKPDSRSCGHLGCPESFNYNIYKEFLYPNPPNSENREQLNAKIEIISDSLRLMNFRHYMLFMRLFLAMDNYEKSLNL